MTTIDECIEKQKTDHVLQAPTITTDSNGKELVAATDSTLSVALVNNTSSSTVYAYITGLASDNNSAVYLLERQEFFLNPRLI